MDLSLSTVSMRGQESGRVGGWEEIFSDSLRPDFEGVVQYMLPLGDGARVDGRSLDVIKPCLGCSVDDTGGHLSEIGSRRFRQSFDFEVGAGHERIEDG